MVGARPSSSGLPLVRGVRGPKGVFEGVLERGAPKRTGKLYLALAAVLAVN